MKLNKTLKELTSKIDSLESEIKSIKKLLTKPLFLSNDNDKSLPLYKVDVNALIYLVLNVIIPF